MATKFGKSTVKEVSEPTEKKEVESLDTVKYQVIKVDAPYGTQYEVRLTKKFNKNTKQPFYQAEVLWDTTTATQTISFPGVITVRGFTANVSGKNKDEVTVYPPKGWDKKPIFEGSFFLTMQAAIHVAVVSGQKVEEVKEEVDVSINVKKELRKIFNEGLDSLKKVVRSRTYRLKGEIESDVVEELLSEATLAVLNVVITEEEDSDELD